MKTIQDIQTEIDNLIKRLSDVYDSLQYELSFGSDDWRYSNGERDECYIRSLENKLSFGESRLRELRFSLRMKCSIKWSNRHPLLTQHLNRRPFKLSIPTELKLYETHHPISIR
jgi:hypothetical protein